MKKMKILLTDIAYLNHNYGAQAIVLPLAENLRKFFPVEITLSIPAAYLEKDKEIAKKFGFKLIANPNTIAALGINNAFFNIASEIRKAILSITQKSGIISREVKDLRNYLQEIKKSDLIIDANGIEFVGNTSWEKN